MRIDTNSPLPPYAQIAADLRRQIRTGELAPGAKLPSIRELAGTYGVAQMTVQHAMGELRKAGLVLSHQGRGVFVSDPLPETVREPAGQETIREPETLEEAQELLRIARERLDRFERTQAQHTPPPEPDRGQGIGL